MAHSSGESVEALVLDYLASKGFANAESALREQLEKSQTPAATEVSFSLLESMLIRGQAAAASQTQSEPVLKPVALPNGEPASEEVHRVCYP